MAKKLIAITSFLLIFVFSSLTVSAETNVPLNIDLKQKIPTSLLPFSEYQNAIFQNHTIYIPERQGNKITAVNAEDGSIKWEHATNAGTAYYALAGAKDVLFFQANGTLQALQDNGTDLNVLWTKPVHASNFTVDGTTLYMFADGKLISLNLYSGVTNWEYSIPSRESAHSNIEVANGKLFFVTDNQLDMQRKMYAMDTTTSQVLWTTNNVDYYAQKLRYVDGTLYVKGYKEMNAFDAKNGVFLWKFLVQENFDFDMNATTIFTKTTDGNVAAYDRTTKAQLWKTTVGSTTRGSMILTPSHVIINGDGAIKWIDMQNGQIVRTITAPGTSIQPFSAKDGPLIGIDTSKNLYYYTAATDTVKPNLTLDSVPSRYSPYESGNANIRFYLSEDAYVKMTVKNTNGLAVQSMDFGLLNKGWNTKYWDGNDAQGQAIPYGVYTLSFDLTDLANNEAVIENSSKTINVADIKGTTLGDTIARKGPDTSNELLTTVPAATQVTILDETKDCYKVNFYLERDSRWYEGFVQKSVVTTRSNPNPQTNQNVIYTVQSGDTLWKISQKFGVTAQAIVDVNHLDPTKYLYVGQKLTIPSTNQAEQPQSVTYSVVAGDTLWKISQKFGVTAQAIVDANHLDPTKYLFVGQKLAIPSTTQPQQPQAVTYSVVAGDTLWKISQQFGVTAKAIVDANQLDPNKYLYVGQKLIIPNKEVQPTPTITYAVVAGDTLWKIGQQFGVTAQAIVDANKLDPTKYLYIGQKLIIPGK